MYFFYNVPNFMSVGMIIKFSQITGALAINVELRKPWYLQKATLYWIISKHTFLALLHDSFELVNGFSRALKKKK